MPCTTVQSHEGKNWVAEATEELVGRQRRARSEKKWPK